MMCMILYYIFSRAYYFKLHSIDCGIRIAEDISEIEKLFFRVVKTPALNIGDVQNHANYLINRY